MPTSWKLKWLESKTALVGLNIIMVQCFVPDIQILKASVKGSSSFEVNIVKYWVIYYKGFKKN